MAVQERRIDVGVGIFSLVVGIVAYVLALPFPGRAALFPKLVSLCLCLLGVMLVIASMHRQAGSQAGQTELSTATLKKPMVVFLALTAYVVVMKLVGFYVTTTIALVLSMRMMGIKSFKVIVIATCLMMLFVFFLFSFSLGIPLPQGFLR